MFRLKSLTVSIALAALAGCSGTDQPAAELPSQAKPKTIVTGNEALPSDHPAIPPEQPNHVASVMADVQEGAMRRSGPPVIIPDAVRDQWSAVRLALTDKEGERSEIRATLGETLALPKGDLKLRAHSFLPAYMSDSEQITSSSNELANPAVLVALSRDDQIINEGWVFRDYPQFNTFASHWVQVELLNADPRPTEQEEPIKGGGS